MTAPGIEIKDTRSRGGTSRTSPEGLEGSWDLDIDDPRWQTGLADPLLEGDWFRSLPQQTRSRYCLTRTCASLAIGIAMENRLSVALNRYLDTEPWNSHERRRFRGELEEESRHSEMFGRFLARVSESGLELPDLGVAWTVSGLAWERWFEAAVRMPELLFMLVLCGEQPITTLQSWYLKAERAQQHPLLRSLYQVHVGDEVRHVRYAQEGLVRHLRAADRQRRNRVRYLAPVAASKAAQRLVWPPQSVLKAFEVPIAALAESRAIRAGQELVSMTLKPLRDCFLGLDVISERTAPLWQSSGIAAPRGDLGQPGAERLGEAP